MRRFGSIRSRLLAGGIVSVSLVIGLMVFAGLGASGTLSPAAAQYAPKNQSPPTITGTARDNSGLVATNGKWQGTVQSYTYRWQLCDKNGNNCADIAGATKQTFTVTSKQVGGRIRVQVTAHNADGATTATSAPTAVVQAAGGSGGGGGGGGPATSCKGSGTVNVKDISPPIRLLVDKWQFNPSVVTRGTNTVVARIHISDTCNHSVAGALVWSTAIPYNQVSAAQATTGNDGYATLNFRVESGFPANPGRQQIMAMLVRATDPNGSALAGKSTRRVLRLSVNAS